MPLNQSKRSIDYTWTLTVFANTMTSILVLVFLLVITFHHLKLNINMNFSISINIITLSYLIILQISLHALLLLASRSVMHLLLIKFATSFLTLAPLKHSSTNVSFLVTIHQSLLLMIYGSFCLLVQQHPRHSWPLKKLDSLNSIITLSLTNTLLLLLIPQVFDTTSLLLSWESWKLQLFKISRH